MPLTGPWAHLKPHPPGSVHRVGGTTYRVVGYHPDTDRYVVTTGGRGNRTYGGLPATAIGYHDPKEK